jgi:hypothetical protein
MPNFIGPLPQAQSVAISLSHAPELSIRAASAGMRAGLASEHPSSYASARNLEKNTT